MAATDVMSSTPMSPGLVTPWGGFEDYLDFPSPVGTPRLVPATPFTMTSSSNMSSSSSSLKPPPASSLASSSSNVPADTSMAGPPPAPGSSPETLFRYYLAAELRRIGSPADDAIIERYVAQHYDSFTRAMERHQTSQASAVEANKDTPMEGIQAFRSPPPSGPSSVPHLLNTASPQALQNKQAPTTIDPHMVETKPSTASPATKPIVVKSEEMDIIVTHPTPSTTSPSATSATYRSKSADDDMSEDDEEDDDDDAKPAKGARLLTIEETPIEGSIMGPSNELRPDPDTYRKLTSKEKRQLRNKISARNFRTRRKEHITLLEQQVSDRDTLIEGLRHQLAQMTTQNKDLQEEVRVLKAKAISTTDVTRIIDALQKSATAPGTSSDAAGQATSLLSRSASGTSLSDPVNSARPPTPSTGTCSSPRSMSPRPSISISKPNTRKDVPSTSGGASGVRSFWGGVGGGSGGNNFMSVHTVLIPSYSEAQFATEKASAVSKQMSTVDASILANLTEKLSLKGANEEHAHASSPAPNGVSSSPKQDSDVNAALVSLIGDDCPPPSYLEAVEQSRSTAAPTAPSSSPTVPNLDDQRVQETVLVALNKAFSSSSAPTTPYTDHKTASTSSTASLDARRIRALMEGRAHLVLVDANGQPWHDQESESEQHVNSAMRSSAVSSSA